MDSALHYLAVNRQRGLSGELAAIATNIANIDTPGYRREGRIFAEFVHAAPSGESLSMADLGAAFADPRMGEIAQTGGALDFAIDGPGFFVTEGPTGVLLTRAGAFQHSPQGLLVTSGGAPVLDDGGAPIALPPDGRPVSVASDGTVSVGDVPLARLQVALAAPEDMSRAGNTAFEPRGAVTQVEEPVIRQGALEQSNVDPVAELARMIEVSRGYERVQGLIENEDERIRDVIDTLGQAV